MIGTIIAFAIIGLVAMAIFLPDKDPMEYAGTGASTAWTWIKKIFDVIVFLVLGIVVLPAMFVMAKWYPTWEKWIKELGDLKDDWIRIILLVPMSIVVGLAMIIMQLLHKPFEKTIEDWFGKKPY
jgi:hypothetical protein